MVHRHYNEPLRRPPLRQTRRPHARHCCRTRVSDSLRRLGAWSIGGRREPAVDRRVHRRACYIAARRRAPRPDATMAPTLEPGATILANYDAYQAEPPQLLDIVVFHPPTSAVLESDITEGCGDRSRRAGQMCSKPSRASLANCSSSGSWAFPVTGCPCAAGGSGAQRPARRRAILRRLRWVDRPRLRLSALDHGSQGPLLRTRRPARVVIRQPNLGTGAQVGAGGSRRPVHPTARGRLPPRASN